jgi:hypothetical protein
MNELLNLLLHDPMLQGVVISLLLARLRVIFKSIDEKAKDPTQVKYVQLGVAAASLLATIASAYSTGSLEKIDMTQVQNFIVVVLAALGTHQLGKDVKDHVSNTPK